jgi:RND family efflux transporter MFP subunit
MKTLFKSMVIAGAVVMTAACGGSGNKAQDSKAAVDVTPTVSVEQVTRRDVPQEVVYSTTVQAFVKNNIAPQSVNRIAQINVEIGDNVKVGDILATMDPAQLQQAEIQKDQALIQMNQAQIQMQQAELQMKNNEAEYGRLKALYDAGGLSRSDFDAIELAYNASKLSYDSSMNQYESSKNQYETVKTQYKNLKDNSELSSPIDGVVTARNYDEGDMYAMTAPIFVVEQISPVKLLVAVSESDYSKVEVADPVKITADALPGKKFDGVVNRIYPTVDPVTRTVTMEVKVENADQELKPGMFARAKIVLSVNNSIIVPDVAVIKQQGSGEHFVYTLNNDNTVSYTKVKLGRRLGETCEYEILEGLEDGDKVVTGGMIRLKDGIKVIVNE